MTLIVLALTGIWHTLAAWHFSVHPARTLGRTTSERPINGIATELFRFLGGLNVALAFLAFTACFVPGARQLAAATLCLANLSQFLQDVRVGRAGLVRGPMFVQILVGDALFTVANLVVAVAG